MTFRQLRTSQLHLSYVTHLGSRRRMNQRRANDMQLDLLHQPGVVPANAAADQDIHPAVLHGESRQNHEDPLHHLDHTVDSDVHCVHRCRIYPVHTHGNAVDRSQARGIQVYQPGPILSRHRCHQPHTRRGHIGSAASGAVEAERPVEDATGFVRCVQCWSSVRCHLSPRVE